MKTSLLALFVGTVIGAVFSFFRLPLPAPQSFIGVLGVAGLWLGYLIVQKFFRS